jgi:type IV secretory pathway VirB2 component (pilin)
MGPEMHVAGAHPAASKRQTLRGAARSRASTRPGAERAATVGGVVMRRSPASKFLACRRVARSSWLALSALFLFPALAFAQSPWERAASNLEATFTGPLARSLALVAIVIGGLMFMFGEGGAKRQISGIVFGGGLALFAAQFLAWLF